jgi:hypothetical protein
MIGLSQRELTTKQKQEWEQWLETCKRIKSGIKPIPLEKEHVKDKRLKHLLNPANFEDFIDFYFASDDFQPAPLGWFHWEAINNLFVKKERKHIWEWHRESAKSVFADIFVPTFMLVKGELNGLILASENADKAANLIKDVEAQLRSNKRLQADFGDFGISGSWMSGFFQTGAGRGFWSFGLGQNPAGVRDGFIRPNVGIVDDADNKDKARNQELTRQRVDWIKGEFMGCLAKDNRYFIYCNNRVHGHGITANMAGDIEEDDKPDESYARVKVYLTEHPKTHEPIFPEGFTEEEIMESLTSQGAVPAWKEYYSLQDAVNKIVDYGLRNALRQLYHLHQEDGDIFTDQNMPWVECLPLHQYDKLVTYCDPAFGETGKGSFKAVGLLGKIGHYYDIIWCWVRQKGDFAKVHRQLAEDIEANRPIYKAEHAAFKIKVSIKHWVEANELQKTELKKTYRLLNLWQDDSWAPHFDDQKKADKIGRIEQLETLANFGYLRFNVQLRGKRDMTTLRNQFKAFPEGPLDGPDMVQGGVDKLKGKASTGTGKKRTGNFLKNQNRRG